MAQWFAIKADHPDALVFFRMGDFYELFFEDAQAAAGALEIALTARGTHAGRPIPMCGVPTVSADAYLARLIRRGFRVAIVEQTERGPSEGGPARRAKVPLARAVVRVVTPGTLTEDTLLDAGRPSLLVAIAAADGPTASPRRLGVAILDIASGQVETECANDADLGEKLARIDPAEILCPDGVDPGVYADRVAPRRLPPTPATARMRAAAAFGVASLDAFGSFSDEEAMALAVALDYAQAAGAGTLPRLAPPVARQDGAYLAIDAATRASLDLVRARDGTEAHTLLGAVARTCTAQGRRLLAQRIGRPLDDLAALHARQAEWLALAADAAMADRLRQALRRAPDMTRALARMSIGRAGPRDLGSLREALGAAGDAAAALAQAISPLDGHAPILRAGDALHASLAATLAAELPARLDDGGVIAEGVDAALDEARLLATDGRRIVAALGAALASRYAMPALKIRHHAQLGYVIEVPQAAVDQLRARPELTLRQGMANGARFTSVELSALDQRIVLAAGDALARERALFADLVADALAHPGLTAIADAIASLDVAQSAASLATSRGWCAPVLTEADDFHLVACRHPVVEAALPPADIFTANDCDLSPNRRLMLLTGPNMAGKSTFLRQTALAVVLAQAGLPVPACSARIGLVDRLFSRVGAADDLARGRSTFMVEMIETASILHSAGPRSLVVVDEIGRGTSTLDGLAIATAVLDALHAQIRCRGIFATHFHELAVQAGTMPRLVLHTMRVREWRGEIVFQHEVIPGQAGRSWGVHVARLAGVPAPVLARARAVLAELERAERARPQSLPLFAHAAAAVVAAEGTRVDDTTPPPEDPVRTALARLDPDAMSPRDAHEAIYSLQSLLVGTRDDLSEVPQTG